MIARLALSIASLEGWRRALVSGLAGTLAAAALPPFNILPLLFVSFTILVWLIDGTCTDNTSPNGGVRNLKSAAWLGWWFCFGYFLVGLYWIGFAFLVEAEATAWMIPFVVVLFPAGLAIFGAATTVLACLFWRDGPSRIVVIALSWVALEWLRGHILTGFPWNLVGYAWSASLEVSQTSALLGIYGLSLLTVFVAASPAALAGGGSAARKGSVGAPAAAVLMTLLMWGAGAWRIAQNPTDYVDGIKLRIVQPSIPQAEKWKPENHANNFERFLSLTEQDGFEDITHIVWPESAVPYILSREPGKLATINQRLGSDRVLITGAIRYDRGAQSAETTFYNSLHVVRLFPEERNSNAEIIATYDKHHLVPFGEYMPFDVFFSWVGLKQLTFGSSSGYPGGAGLRTLLVPGAPAVAPLICYEIIFPSEVVPRVGQARWIINLTNDAWFGDSSGPRQHLQQARMRAIETGLPIVRAANNGLSAIVDPVGRILHQLDLNEAGTLDGGLPRSLPKPLYARLGDVGFGSLGIALVIVGLFLGRSKPEVNH